MYTGIIQGCVPVTDVKSLPGLVRFSVKLPSPLGVNLVVGASVSLDGVCLTVSQIDKDVVWFDAMQETLHKTTLGDLFVGRKLNVERSAAAGTEVGGHIISGHIDGMIQVIHKETPENNCVLTFQVPTHLMKYIFSKGFVALDGASLTIVDADPASHTFKVWLIPETLRLTHFSEKQVGSRLNLEVEYQTKVLVDTVERLLPQYLTQQRFETS